MNKTANYELTIIVPVYNEEGNIQRLTTELSHYLQISKLTSCILFVNDGSTDKSEQFIQEACKANKDFFT